MDLECERNVVAAEQIEQSRSEPKLVPDFLGQLVRDSLFAGTIAFLLLVLRSISQNAPQLCPHAIHTVRLKTSVVFGLDHSRFNLNDLPHAFVQFRAD